MHQNPYEILVSQKNCSVSSNTSHIEIQNYKNTKTKQIQKSNYEYKYGSTIINTNTIAQVRKYNYKYKYESTNINTNIKTIYDL